jgi:hypothetical protein
VNLNLILAMCWLVFALGLFLLSWLRPEAAFLRLGNTGFPLAWVAVLFFLYNIVRWWGARMAAQRQELLRRSRSRHRDDEREPRPATYDPNFDFSDRPPPRGEEFRR